MTIPRRTDISTDENIAAHRPTVLADLPHIGRPAARSATARESQPSPQTARKLKSSHPAFAESQDDFESELAPPPQPNGRRQTRYVDQAHIDHEWERHDQSEDADDEPRERRSRSSDRIVQRHSPSTPRHNGVSRHGGWRAILSDVHAQLAPFAGLIVTTALVASAALLFLMMSGNQNNQAGFDEFALPGFRVDASDSLNQMESDAQMEADTGDTLADSIFDESSSEELQEGTQTFSEQQTIPASSSSVDTSAVIPAPVIEEINESTIPLGSLTFPVTSTPLALDYSKALAKPADDLQALPAVAELGSLPTTEPINR